MPSSHSPHRQSIRQKTTQPNNAFSLSSPLSTRTSSSPWKHNLKEKCLTRAREKRKNSMLKKRGVTSLLQSSLPSSSISSSLPLTLTPSSHDDKNKGTEGERDTGNILSNASPSPSPKDTVRQVIQEQLQETGVRVFSSPNSCLLSPSRRNSTSCNSNSHIHNNSAMKMMRTTNMSVGMGMDVDMDTNVNMGMGMDMEQPQGHYDKISFHFSPIPTSSKTLLSPSDNSNASMVAVAQIPSLQITPLSNHNDRGQEHEEEHEHDPHHYHHNNHNGDTTWVISEEELYELMQEIEEEIRSEVIEEGQSHLK